MPEFYIGLMSGTSLDGIDAVIADFSAPNLQLAAHSHQPFAPAVREELAALNHSGRDELRRAAIAANEITRCYAASVNSLLAQASLTAADIRAIGCHGQTVRHQPADGYTLQLINGSLLAELTGATVICDFRNRDIAAGGEGAPLVPAFHHAMFTRAGEHRAIVNIGGIANVTDLPGSDAVTGFDCGPGNLLLDAWTQRHLKQPFDRDGEWAQSGVQIPGLLARLVADEFFRLSPPKSTGREHFNLTLLEQHLHGDEKPADVQATLLALSARTIADAIVRYCKGVTTIYLCGGGARNVGLVSLLTSLLAPRQVRLTDALGVNVDHVEALAFAWLARQTLNSQPGNLPAVTGARGERILGAIYRP
ncbi:MAG: anmK [Betaproteobacteria bacterium]|nr:anmK [Betaproteobacteria bacterium]